MKKRDYMDFVPAIWETNREGIRLRYLVCQKSMVSTKPTKKEDGGDGFDRITHPVAILLSSPAVILCPLVITEGDWQMDKPSGCGISDGNARRALAEAWRSVEGVDAESWPAKIHRFKFKSNLQWPGDPDAKDQERTMLRNVNIAVFWDRWKKGELTMQERADELQEMGIQITRSELKKAAENLGI